MTAMTPIPLVPLIVNVVNGREYTKTIREHALSVLLWTKSSTHLLTRRSERENRGSVDSVDYKLPWGP